MDINAKMTNFKCKIVINKRFIKMTIILLLQNITMPLHYYPIYKIKNMELDC